jgi:hypothetical protein
MGKFEKQLSRRILSEDGWMFFCRICGKYQPETDFYKKKDSKWGIDSKCKLHYQRNNKEDEDKSMEHLKLDPIKEEDFKNVQELLELMGYTFNGKKTIHEQFVEKNKLKLKQNEK